MTNSSSESFGRPLGPPKETPGLTEEDREALRAHTRTDEERLAEVTDPASDPP